MLTVEKWMNQYGDVVLFIGNEYVLYDKCDKADLVANRTYLPNNTTIEDYKEAYRKNGFKPVSN